MGFTEQEKAGYVRKTFNTIARRYDLMNTLMSFGLDQQWRRMAVEHVAAHPGANILDVCCGTGKLVMSLAQEVGENGRITGLDFSENMLAIARQRVEDSIYRSRVTLIRGDAMAMPFENEAFDGATVGWGLRNLPDLRAGIREMTRVVKPGGWIVSLDMGKPTLLGFKQMYWLYFERIIPIMGQIWAKKASAYRYLHDSARDFPPQQELTEIFAECGLTHTGFVNLAGGVVALVFGKKPNRE